MAVLLHLIAALAWTELWSDEHNRTYFWNAEAGEAAWRLPPGAELHSAPPPPPMAAAEEPRQGWADCTSDAAGLFNGGALQRAFRSIARTAHPDKGGSATAFQSATATRDFLKSPLRFFAHRALHDEGRQYRLTDFNATSTDSVVRGGRASVTSDGEGWPRLTVDAALAPTIDLSRHVWRIALAHANASTIEYSGDSGVGGYDVCCHFVSGSVCELRNRDDAVAALEHAAVDSSGQRRPWYEERGAHFVRHDCPLPPGAVNISISKPLHLKAAGRWSAVVLVTDAATPGADPPPTACLSFVFSVGFAPRPPTEAPPAANATIPAEFEQLSSGRWCRDGADLLEGSLDGYTDCDPQTRLCQLTKKCRARCAKRSACRYYTTYASGFCQLSSRCADEATANDASARTFVKRGATGGAEQHQPHEA